MKLWKKLKIASLVCTLVATGGFVLGVAYLDGRIENANSELSEINKEITQRRSTTGFQFFELHAKLNQVHTDLLKHIKNENNALSGVDLAIEAAEENSLGAARLGLVILASQVDEKYKSEIETRSAAATFDDIQKLKLEVGRKLSGKVKEYMLKETVISQSKSSDIDLRRIFLFSSVFFQVASIFLIVCSEFVKEE